MTIGFTMPPSVNKVEIPFIESDNLIIIPVIVNDFLKLNFIIDTGVETPILTEITYANILGINYIREVIIPSPGINDSIHAYVGNKVNFRLPGNVIGHNLNILVLKEDHLNLSEKIGLDVHGIIGYDLFKKFIVEINYDDKILVLHRQEKYRPKNKFNKIPIDIVNSKPYITSIINQSKENDTVRLMVDTGASHAILLDINQTTLKQPEKTIPARLGTGIGGDISGQIGRIDSFTLCTPLEFRDVIVSIPEVNAYGQSIKRGSRHGTIGGDILSRLFPIFDYGNGHLYIEKGERFSTKFEFDMSGLSLAVQGAFLDSLVVDHLRDNSPAALAGIEQGDVILTINGHSLQTSPLSKIHALLRKKPNYKIRLKILRSGEKIRKEFRLKRTI